jgi:hypothetical protein
MKVSELKETIRAKVRETLYTGPNALASVVKDPAYNALPQIEKTKVTNTLRQKQSVNLEEDDQPGEYTMDKIYKMTRTELIDFAGLTPQDAAKYSTRTLQSIALELADDKPSDEGPIDEEDFMDDDDNIIIEDVEDVDSSGDEMAKYYDKIYEINANVAPGSRYQIEVKKDGNFIILTQDNGQEIVVHPEDVRDLVKVILKIDRSEID